MASAFNHWSISPAPEVSVLFVTSFPPTRILFDSALRVLIPKEVAACSLPQPSGLQKLLQLPVCSFVHLLLLLRSLPPSPWWTKDPWPNNELPSWQMEKILSKAHFNWTWNSKSITAHSSVIMNMIYVYKLSWATSFFILVLWKTDMPLRKHLLETGMKEESGETDFIIKASIWCPCQSKT